MGGETYRYVPDIYIESNNQKYLYEIKSRWTFGYDFKDKIYRPDEIKKNMCKFKYCNDCCNTNNIKFIIIIDDKIYSYKELYDKIYRSIRKRIENTER
jgi:hypothetical protein